MISLALPLLLHATPVGPVDVVVARRIEMPAARAARFASGLGRALARAGVESVRAPELSKTALPQESTEKCKNDRHCLSELARRAGSRLVVGLDVGVVLDQASFSLVALVPEDESQLLREAFTVPVTEDDSAIERRFEAFAARLARALPAPAAARDAPLAHGDTSLIPRGRDESGAAPWGEVAEEPRSVVFPVTVSVAAAGGAAATAWFLFAGQQAEAALHAGEYQSWQGPASVLTRSEAEARVQEANQARTVAAATGAATALLVTWAVLLWTAD